MPPPLSFLPHIQHLDSSSPLLLKSFATTMAGKALVPFVASTSTFALDREPLPANQDLVNVFTEEEAEAVMKMPVVILPMLGPKEVPREANMGSANPLVRPNQRSGPSATRSAPRSTKSTTTRRGRGGHAGVTQRPTTGELRPKDIVVCLFADPSPPMPLEKGENYAFSIKTKGGNVIIHNYTSTPTYMHASPT
jgi:hypothetical protein